MGQRLALNVANHGLKVAVFNRTTRVMKDFVAANPDTPGCLAECESLAGVLAVVKEPRNVV
jgi:6-phosphogluconate dehydrogenase